MVTEERRYMATLTKEDRELLGSLTRVLNQLELADDEMVDALRDERKWKASSAASSYKKELQAARLNLEKIDATLRKVNAMHFLR